ncbi:iron dicitrate transporter FecR [Novosphingobium sediminis]|uniref:Iron dicitrate transporter FecR n=2 Tax=Novosphingobium sediminis TaxID=707214 RepID=A0A512AMU3_9SPHN|nr:iron dicitrate transporter FecR [Novosphingobium sediminis]
MAAEWVARMDSGSWTEADEAALQTWLAADPRRQGLLLQTQAAWMLPDALREQEAAEVPAPANDTGGKWMRRGVLGGMIAASAAAIITVRGGLSRDADFVTRVGEIRRVPLDDGSIMTINSGSELKVSLSRRAREIQLLQGEAWFDVAKDAERPFIVASGPVRAKAVGTAFSVRKRDDGVEVLVTEGVVETWSDQDSSRRLTVTAGERAVIKEWALVHYREGDTPPVDRALAWRNGMIDLNGTTLREAADEFNRYNQRQIVIADPGLASEQFDGLFKLDDPEGFAETLKVTLPVAINTSDPHTIRVERSNESILVK